MVNLGNANGVPEYSRLTFRYCVISAGFSLIIFSRYWASVSLFKMNESCMFSEQWEVIPLVQVPSLKCELLL